jgi:hypothetical protein
MIGYAEREIFTQRELQVLEKADQLVQLAPYELQGDEVRCHELARAVGQLLKLHVVDGWYGHVSHSWLWLEPLVECGFPRLVPRILDCYCPGRLPQVQLVDCSTVLPFEYRRGDSRIDIRHHVVHELVEMMRGAL